MSNTTPLIALAAATGSLDVLKALYARVVVPLEVVAEICSLHWLRGIEDGSRHIRKRAQTLTVRHMIGTDGLPPTYPRSPALAPSPY